ncbi:helix-turn-helix domain-containing protein [Streptomyces sp. NPDC048290]|uniref:helix-turn-helix domain-containing protein n=1 Tax=Streptomyces sp. NPDC048290 TaxID=3155811 RepID=UPI00341C6415
MPPARGQLTFTELFDLPVVLDLRTAARALGISASTAYQLIHRNEFPCVILRVGGQYRVPTSQLMRALGIEERSLYDLELGPDPDSDTDDPWRTGT